MAGSSTVQAIELEVLWLMGHRTEEDLKIFVKQSQVLVRLAQRVLHNQANLDLFLAVPPAKGS